MHVARTQPRANGAGRMVPLPSEMPSAWQTAWPWLFWACWGAWLAVSDLRTDDVQPAVMRLIVGAGVLGYSRPRTWWLWSLALAAWIPAESLVASWFHLDAIANDAFGAWLFPPLPAIAGGLLGRSIAKSLEPSHER